MPRVTAGRALLVLTGALLLAYAVAVVPPALFGGGAGGPSDRLVQAEPDAPPRPPGELFPPAGKAFVGAMTDAGPRDFAALDAFTAAARHQPPVLLFSSWWGTDTFDRTLFDRVNDRGMLPMLGWEPWDHRVDQAARAKNLPTREIDRIRSDQPAYRLSRIAGGEFDGYLRTWADGIRSLGYPVAIRFAHEMNGDWYPWSGASNGNRPGDYVKAWRHVHDLFRATGATNVIWVWSPNAKWDPAMAKLSTFYPGDDYVDWVGVTGYYGIGAFTDYRSFEEIFGPTLTEVRALTRKPVVITETGASDAAGRKAEWIRETFRALPRHPDVIGLIWFEVDKEQDWRIVSSPAVTEAFAQAVADHRYQVTWSPDRKPRTRLEG